MVLESGAAAAVARLLPRPPSLCAVWSANAINYSILNLSPFFSRGTQLLHMHLSLMPGVGRHKVAQAFFLVSASTSYPFVLFDIYSRISVSFLGLTVSFLRRIATVHRGEMPWFLYGLLDGVRDELLREKHRATDNRSAIIRVFCSDGYPLRDNPRLSTHAEIRSPPPHNTLEKSTSLRDIFKGGHPLRINP